MQWLVKGAIITVLVAFLGWGIYALVKERHALQTEVGSLRSEVKSLTDDNTKLQGDIQYYQNPANLLKAAKAQFNYRAPDESLIIVVPPTSTASSTQ